MYLTAFLQSQRAITPQWPNPPKQKLGLAYLLLLINIHAKYQVIQVETVGGVQCTRFLQSIKSIPDHIFAKSKGHISAMTKFAHLQLLINIYVQLLINIYAKYQPIQVEIVGGVQCTRFLQTDREFSFRKSIPNRIFNESCQQTTYSSPMRA